MVRPDDDPTLTGGELADLLLEARRPDMSGNPADVYPSWASAGPLAVGDELVPTNRNGHFYRVTASDGAAGAVEPVWPTDEGAEVILDGVTYVEAGPAPWLPTFDLNAAAAEGWRTKAGKVAGEFSFGSDGQSFNTNEIFDMCTRQADFYRKRIVGSMPVSPGAP